MMKSQLTKYLSILIALMLLISLMSCAAQDETESPADTTTTAEEDPNDEEPTEEDPIDEDWPTIVHWAPFSRASHGHESLATHPGWIELQNRVQVNVEFINPSPGNEAEQFNLMIAAREFPDTIAFGWLTVAGGAARYIQDDVIIPLNDYMEEYAPDFVNYMAERPDFARQAMMDDGTIYCFPEMYDGPELAHWLGPIVRYDILAEVPGYDIDGFPYNLETVDEWYETLSLIRDSEFTGDSGRPLIPLSFDLWQLENSDFVAGAYGIKNRFFSEEGTVRFGPMDDRYLEYLTTMNQWYEEGLIDEEFAANDGTMITEKILDNRTITMVHAMGGGITRHTGLARPDNPDFSLRTTKYPVLEKGTQPIVAFRTHDFNNQGTAITTAAENIEAAMRLFNYDYSEEGILLANFGVEGDTFEWVDGNPVFTDIVANNPDYSRDVATGVFVRAGDVVGVMLVDWLEQRDSLPEQLGEYGRALWIDAKNEIRLPPVTPTQEESSEYAALMGEINTYVQEMTISFIMGDEPLNQFESFRDTLRAMNIERATEIQQAQVDRYMDRPSFP